MGKAIPTQHPAVVLRSNYRQLRALLVIAMIAVIGLSAAVVILARNDDRDAGAGSATQVSSPGPTGTTRYDSGPEEGTRGLATRGLAPAQRPSTRYDGGPEEGTRGVRGVPASGSPLVSRYDGGPVEGTRGAPASGSPLVSRYDGGPEEGTRGPGR